MGLSYYYDSTSAVKRADSSILLYFRYSGGVPAGSPCIDTCCTGEFRYKVGLLAPGKYSVYNSVSYQPTGNPPVISGPSKVGEFTVSSTSISFPPHLASSKHLSNSDISLYVYDVRGKLISRTGSVKTRLRTGVYYLRMGDHLFKQVVLCD